jgi:hypothetical protein
MTTGPGHDLDEHVDGCVRETCFEKQQPSRSVQIQNVVFDTNHISNIHIILTTLTEWKKCRLLATIGGIHIRYTDWWEGFMKYATDIHTNFHEELFRN